MKMLFYKYLFIDIDRNKMAFVKFQGIAFVSVWNTVNKLYTNSHTHTHKLLLFDALEFADKQRLIIFTRPLRSGSIWHKVSFKRSLTRLNSEFSFS